MDLPEVVYAKDQPPYLPLPVFKYPDDETGAVLMRWHMAWKDRWLALWHGDIYVTLLTFNKPLQPIKVFTDRPAE